MTQAELGRHVRALVTSLKKSGLTVTATKVTFVQGSPVIEVAARLQRIWRNRASRAARLRGCLGGLRLTLKRWRRFM